MEKYFEKALSDFTFDVASGGAIRHLADRGYPAPQIRKMLDFPTPYERVQQTVWEHLLAQGVLRLEEPGNGEAQEKYGYVEDYDRFGRKSFRRVLLKEGKAEPAVWRESRITAGTGAMLLEELGEKCRENGEDFSYASCDFGLQSRREPEAFAQRIQRLQPQLRDYVLGLPWERRMAYHRLDERMRRIVTELYGNGEYQGTCYFLRTAEKLRIG